MSETLLHEADAAVASGGGRGSRRGSEQDQGDRGAWEGHHVPFDAAPARFLLDLVKDPAAAVVQLAVHATTVVKPHGVAVDGERRLVRRARNGDVAAFESLLARHDHALRGLAFRMLGSAEAMDDALQDAYLRAFRGLDGFAGGSAFGTWLHRIVANTCLDEIRRRDRHPQVSLEEAAEPAISSGEDGAMERLDLQTALARLEPELRSIVLMIDAEGFSYQEVADMLGIPAGTIASRLSRARSALRPHLQAPTVGGPTR